jgi:N-acetylglucosaminyldiphosphoundecaprenol N-acetyl-beta-D-mannosaminyltransferase
MAEASRTTSVPCESFAGVRVDRITLEELVRVVTARIRASSPPNSPLTVAFVNAHSIESIQDRPALMNAFGSLDVCVPDGISIVAASVLQGGRIRHRFSGIDVLREAMKIDGSTHYFMGSTPDVLADIVRVAERDVPEARVVGTSSPPLWPWPESEDQRLVDDINAAAPDFLWVGLSAPKQEAWIARVEHRLNARVALAIGYGFDTFSDRKPMSPPWVRRAGLEWLYRLAQDPLRIWRRVFVTGPRFLGRILLARARTTLS